jgi:hypothetical protein
MEKLILIVRLFFRRFWRSVGDFLERNGLHAVPPLPAACAVVIFGIGIPLAMDVDTRPTALTRSLALQRLESFVQQGHAEALAATPSGRITTVRPGVAWERRPGATRYSVRLRDANKLVIGTDLVREPRFLLPEGKRLQWGSTYEIEVRAYGEEDADLGLVARASFETHRPDEEEQALRDQITRRLPEAEGHLVLAGFFAERGSPHDLATALVHYRELAPDGEAIDAVLRALARLGLE